MKRVLRVYLDTSVIGGCFDDEFQLWSNALMVDFQNGIFKPVISSVVTEELERAPQQVKDKLHELILIGAEILEPDNEALSLLEEYQNRQIVTEKYSNDLLHIAIATVSAEVLVSWNFKHIVRLEKIQQFNAVNISCGFRPIEIHSPREVAHYEE
jgi:rRNA-processing protein FCF1